jgi:Zn finger protein HypA/HybF involved in hydrogenase expression
MRKRRICESCGTEYVPHAENAKYCESCRKSKGRINQTRLLRFALEELGINKGQLIERFAKSNRGEYDD